MTRLTLATTAAALLLSFNCYAATSCKQLPDPKFPGLQQCVASVDIEKIEATPPEPQKMSLWCWAASLSAIFTAAGHPISQDNIVIQNFGKIENTSGGDFLQFEERLNRTYVDDEGNKFKSVATRVWTPNDAADALDNDFPILYTTTHHATVQLSLTYQVAPGGPTVVTGGELWDPEPGAGNRPLSRNDVQAFTAAWSIDVKDVK
jgi:hypothetical protein